MKLCNDEDRNRRREYKKQYYRDNFSAIQEYQRKYRKDNLCVAREYAQKYRKDNLSTIQEYMRKYRRKYDAHRKAEDPNFRLACALRTRLRKAIHNGQKTGSAVRDLGCSISAFRLYIESQFEPGMSWDNYGKWHLDHVMPISSFDLTDRMQFLEACNWLNYQPLWALDNIIKSDKVAKEKNLDIG